ncbi:MAG: hypothetical protein ACKVPX_17460 [Myxococcaceae bacterium]
MNGPTTQPSWLQLSLRRWLTFGHRLDSRNTDTLFSVYLGAALNVVSTIVASLPSRSTLVTAAKVALVGAQAGLMQLNRDTHFRSWMNGNEAGRSANDVPM